MIKHVCGTYSEASGKNCDRSKKSKTNICAKEMSNWGGQNAFYKWAATDYGEPTVRGHMTFVRTDCNGGHRMDLSFQSEQYQLASKYGAALNGEDYEGWRKVSWNPPLPNHLTHTLLSGLEQSIDRQQDAARNLWSQRRRADMSVYTSRV